MRGCMNKSRTITVGYRIYYQLRSPEELPKFNMRFKTPFNYDLNVNLAQPRVALHLTLHYETPSDSPEKNTYNHSHIFVAVLLLTCNRTQ